MAKVTLIVVAVLAVVLIGGCLFLAYWDFRVPAAPVEKVLPDARFPR